MSSDEFYCNCKRFCKGVHKKVSAPTYYRHQEHCDPLLQYGQHLQDFLRSKPEVPFASSSNAWQSTQKHVIQDSSVLTDPTNT